MTELSPAAQAVLGAAINDAAGILNDSDSEWVRGYANQIAAALRAAAHEVAPFPGRYPMNEYMEGFRDAK